MSLISFLSICGFRNGELPAIEEPKEIVQSWTIENKYYSADVKLHLVDYGSANDFSEEYEGLILLPHPEKVVKIKLIFLFH